MEGANSNLIDEQIKSVINARLTKLASSSGQSCIEFPTFLTKLHRNYIRKLAALKGLESTTNRSLGIKYIKVHKNSSSNLVQQAATFRLTDLSKKVIFHYLKTELYSCKDVQQEDRKLRSNPHRPRIPIYRFCTGALNKGGLSPPPKSQNKLAEEFRSKLPIFQFKNQILNAIDASQVTMLCSETFGGRTTEVPQYLLEEFNRRNECCRVIVSMDHKITAVCNSETVSSQRGERLGLTIGYQIQLESMSSMSTNLLYTTNSFFLRCIMSSVNRDTFSAITHVILEDISEESASSDMLLLEIREALLIYPRLKVVLMCARSDIAKLRKYFKDAALVEMNISYEKVLVYHLDELSHFLTKNTHGAYLSQEDEGLKDFANTIVVDEILANCMDLGNEEAFERFVKMLNQCKLDVNIQHSETNITFGIASARHDRLNYLMLFVSLGGDLTLTDKLNKSALIWAQESGSHLCLQFFYGKLCTPSFNSNCGSVAVKQGKCRTNPKWSDANREQIYGLIKFIHVTTKTGNILVLLPSFRDVVKQEFLLKNKIALGLLPNDVRIHLLHRNTQITEFRCFFQMGDSSNRSIFLCTELSLSALALKGVAFLIDSGRRLETNFCDVQLAHEKRMSWISKNCAERRKQLVAIENTTVCLRLYTKSQFESFEELCVPELNRLPLENICLQAKLLSPRLNIREYFERIRNNIPPDSIRQAICVLREIGAFDELESVTPLGVRLVDIPIHVQLAKALIFGIALQCLDPVLTIVSMLAYRHPGVFLQHALSDENHGKVWLDGSSNSDHLMLLRLYQNWIDQPNHNEKILNEEKFVLNAELEVISIIRSQLVGILRAAGLIQSSGILNIHFINQQANNWPLVKSALVAGMYPNICRFDQGTGAMILRNSSKVKVNECSILTGNDAALRQTNWVMYQLLELDEETKTTCNTLITPTCVSLFAGDLALFRDEVIPIEEDSSDSESEAYGAYTKLTSIRYNIDDWLAFILNEEDAHLLFAIRQEFYSLLNDIVRVPDDDKHRKQRNSLQQGFGIVEPIGNLLKLEDLACNLPEPKRVGERPNAFSTKFTRNREKIATLKQNMMNLSKAETAAIQQETVISTNKAFFILKVESKEQVRLYMKKKLWQNSTPAWKKLIVKHRQFPTINVVVFLLLKNYNVFCGAAQLFFDGEKHFLNEIVCRDVSVNELKTIYFTYGDSYPECFDGQELDFHIGKRFFEVFI